MLQQYQSSDKMWHMTYWRYEITSAIMWTKCFTAGFSEFAKPKPEEYEHKTASSAPGKKLFERGEIRVTLDWLLMKLPSQGGWGYSHHTRKMPSPAWKHLHSYISSLTYSFIQVFLYFVTFVLNSLERFFLQFFGINFRVFQSLFKGDDLIPSTDVRLPLGFQTRCTSAAE